jgi:osmotically-inducible protein OsmY
MSVLKQKIHDKLHHVVLWDATDIRFKVSKGVVTLLGTVADKDAMHKTEELISSIEGVKGIKNSLKIKSPGIAAVISEIATELTRVMTDDGEGKSK